MITIDSEMAGSEADTILNICDKLPINLIKIYGVFMVDLFGFVKQFCFDKRETTPYNINFTT